MSTTIIPWTGVKLSKQHTTAEFPYIHPYNVEESSYRHRQKWLVLPKQIELFNDEAAETIHKK